MVEVQTACDGESCARTLWCIFGMCGSITLIDGFDTGAIGFVAASLLSEWRLQSVALGPVLSAALLGWHAVRCSRVRSRTGLAGVSH
jgi:AAHS family 4-hydroxybenzoate transporter-like MFS transporter